MRPTRPALLSSFCLVAPCSSSSLPSWAQAVRAEQRHKRTRSRDCGTRPRRSPIRFDRARSTITAMEKRDRSCCTGRLRSTVTKASNSRSARARRSPFLSAARFRHCPHVVSQDVPREASIDALVEKHPHDALTTIRAVASSRNAATCSRLTVGKPTRKSSIVSPPSRDFQLIQRRA